MTMAMMSLSTGLSAFMSVINGSVDIKDVASTLLTSGAMMCTMIVWPIMSQNYQKIQRKKREKERLKKYNEYVEQKREKIQAEMKIQRQILIDNYLPLSATKDIIYESINIIQTSTYVFARGTTLNTAISGMETQLESSSKSENRARIVFFFSDGEITVEDKVDTREFGALKDYISEGAVLGYGTDEGGHMYVRTDNFGSYQYVKYQGKKAISKIDENNLELVSDSLGIDYINMNKHSNIDKKLSNIKDGVTYKFDVVDKSSYQDTYYFLMVPLLGLLVYEFINFRRGV